MQRTSNMAGLPQSVPRAPPFIPDYRGTQRPCGSPQCVVIHPKRAFFMWWFLFLVFLHGSSNHNGAMATTSDASGLCVLKGRIYTERLWYGYLLDKAFQRDYAKIQYQISYPVKECCTSLLIYYDDQIKGLTQDMTCEDREGVLPSNNNQIIPLHTHNRTVGCSVWNETGEPYYVCVGERIFRSSGPRTWYFALSRCQASTPLTLTYAFNVSGYYGDCEEDPLVRTYIPPSPKAENDVYVSVALGIVAGLALIAAAIFFVLWLVARRRAANSKGSSVTSSQATMTQDDIFYVNPSLSDREQGAEYNSQASSENYYEVIPERRSYESINPHLLAAGPGGVAGPGHHPLAHPHPHALNSHLHPAHAHVHVAHPRQVHMHAAHHNSHVKESAFHRPHPPTQAMGYVFDDYPPPPYQPPRLAGSARHHTLHHPTPHHHHTLSLPTSTRPRPALINLTQAGGIAFPPVLPPAPAPAGINNNTASSNNNNGNNSNNNLPGGPGTLLTAGAGPGSPITLQGETSA